MIFEHWSNVPPHVWPCKYFKPQEVACQGTGKLLVHTGALRALDRLRHDLGTPLHISSGYRSPYHNAAVGGAPMSSHLDGHAFDLQLRGNDKKRIRQIAEAYEFTGFGMHYQTFIHIDMGRRREW